MTEYIFVYDHSVLKGNEETDPDPTEAIRFFYPPTVDKQEQHELCSQLMGVVKLLENLLNSRPSVFQLANGSGTVACIHTRSGNLTFAYFTTNQQVGKESIVRHANELYRLIIFYNGCLDCVFADTKRSEPLSESVARYLAFVTSSGNSLLSIFSPMPQYNICDSINYQLVVTLLDNCAGWPQVLGGCIFYRERLVLSQLPLNLTSQVSIIKGRHLQAHDKYPDFLRQAVLPFPSQPRPGVALFRCFLPRQDYQALISHSAHSGGAQNNNNSSNNRFNTRVNTPEQDAAPKEGAGGGSEAVVTCCPNSEFISVLIYAEAHSDMFLALVINDCAASQTDAYLTDLYKLCFPAIGDLEFKLLQQESCSANSGRSAEIDTDSMTNDPTLPTGALVYDALDRSLGINHGIKSKSVQPVTFLEEQLVYSVGRLRNQLAPPAQEDPDDRGRVREITLGGGPEGGWILAKKKTNREVYEIKPEKQSASSAYNSAYK